MLLTACAVSSVGFVSGDAEGLTETFSVSVVSTDAEGATLFKIVGKTVRNSLDAGAYGGYTLGGDVIFMSYVGEGATG